MSGNISDAPDTFDEQDTSSTTGKLAPVKKQRAVFWPWFGGLLVVGLVIVIIVTATVSNWLHGIQSAGSTPPASTPTTLNVGRSAIYADLNFTLLNVQYASSFSNDPIHSGTGVVRATVRVNNPTKNTIDVSYYDVARLLGVGKQPITPTNLHLAAALKGGADSNGWIDFPVSSKPTLKLLQFQIGNAATNETLVKIPTSGKYDPSQYDVHVYNQSLTINYNYGPYGGKHLLIYHLTSVDVCDSYNGAEAPAGQQFYALNFTVDNPNGVYVGPGYGYDYIRLLLNVSTPPMDNTLPNGFQHNSRGTSGHVTYLGPAGMTSLRIGFLVQFYQGQDTYQVSL